MRRLPQGGERGIALPDERRNGRSLIAVRDKQQAGDAGSIVQAQARHVGVQ